MSAHDSVLKTPQPSAWSTETKRIEARSTGPQHTKQDVKRNLMNMDISTESLGILSLDDMRTSKDSMAISYSTTDQASKILEERQRALESTRALLKKYETFRNHSLLSESTVNESDLRESPHSVATSSRTIDDNDARNKSHSINHKQTRSSMKQHNAVSPNSSSSLDISASSQSVLDYIRDIQTQFEANSSASLSDILGNVTKQSLEYDSGMFQPAEDVKDQFEADERVWREKYASLPTASRASFASQPNSKLFDEQMSFGNYFAAKSDNCSLFAASSPTALINSTAIDIEDVVEPSLSDSHISAIRADDPTGGVLSVSQIQNLISGEENTPGKLVERLLTAPLLKDAYYSSRSSLGSPSVHSLSKLKYAATSTKIYATKSLDSIGADKENARAKDRTLTSCGSTSSMDSIPGDSVKLSSNKAELVWGCVKEGRAVQQDVTVRNKNGRRVKYLVQMTNPTFKLSNVEPQGAIVLHALETRQLNVACAPSAIGPQTGHLLFTPVVRKEPQQQLKQHVALYAYGGHAHVRVEDVARDLAGKLWLSFGALDGRRVLTRRFTVRNAGTVDGFVAFAVCNRRPCAYDDVGVHPQRVVVARDATVDVVVTFRPSKSDLQLLAAARDAEIAVVRMTSGPDVTRRRINRIVRKMPKDEGVARDPFVRQLGAAYRDARRADDAKHFDESTKSFKALMQTLECTEIALLVDRDLDATLMPEPDDATVLFKTMVCPDEPPATYAEHLSSERSYAKLASVEPNKVILTPPTKARDCFFLGSNYDRVVEFRAVVDQAEGGGLVLTPGAGRVRPGEVLRVLVECREVTMVRQDFEVVFEVDDEVLKVSVSVLNI